MFHWRDDRRYAIFVGPHLPPFSLLFQYLCSFLAVAANRKLRAIPDRKLLYLLNFSGLWPAVWTMGNLGEPYIDPFWGEGLTKIVDEKVALGSALPSTAW